jgi:peptide/nickel transport system substrate-binding protein
MTPSLGGSLDSMIGYPKAPRLHRGLLALCVATAAWMAACTSPDDTPPADTRASTLVIGSTADIEGVNYLVNHNVSTNTQVLHQLFLTLVKESPDFVERPPTFQPLLAESWEWSDDHLALTFKLREGVTWSDGRPVTAEDVRWTWQAQTNPEVAWEGLTFKENVRDVEVIDPLTVRFHFNRVDPMGMLHANEGVILPKHAWSEIPFERWRESGRWFRQHLVTDGPFRLASWAPGDELVLERNPAYFEEGLPRLDRVVFRQVPDQSAMVTRLLNGELDFGANISPEDVPRLRQAEHLELLEYWGIGYIYFAWNHREPLFADARVRRALTYGLDRQGMVDALWGDYARVGMTPIVQSVWAFNDALEPYPYDPAETRRLLAEAGWRDTDGDGVLDKDGRPFHFELLVHSGNVQRQNAAVMAQQQLAQVGIDVDLTLLDFATFVEAVDEGRFEAYIAGLTMGTDLDLSYLLKSDQVEAGLNHTAYNNPEIDRLIDEANSQADARDMKRLLDEVQVIVHRDQPMTFLWESKRLNVINRRVQGAEPNLLSPFENLEEWWIEPPP